MKASELLSETMVLWGAGGGHCSEKDIPSDQDLWVIQRAT